MRWLRITVLAGISLASCRKNSAPLVTRDDARESPRLVDVPRGPRVGTWAELAAALEPCLRTGHAETDTRIRVTIVGDRALMEDEACWGEAADAACLRRTVEAAIYVGDLQDVVRTLSITRRKNQLVQFGPVRIRTIDDIKRAIAETGRHEDIEILEVPCRVEW